MGRKRPKADTGNPAASAPDPQHPGNDEELNNKEAGKEKDAYQRFVGWFWFHHRVASAQPGRVE